MYVIHWYSLAFCCVELLLVALLVVSFSMGCNISLIF